MDASGGPATSIFLTLDMIEFRLSQLNAVILKPIACVDESNVCRMFFGKPGIVHYFVIGMARSLSGMRAALELYGNGFYLETMTLLRSVIENQSHLNYVCAGVGPGQIDQISRDFIGAFFQDTIRRPGERAPHRNLTQKEIHRRIARAIKLNQRQYLDPLGLGSKDLDEVEMASNLSRLYNFFSNFLHGRYPEMMTLFGYDSQRLELRGTQGWQDEVADMKMFEELTSIVAKDMKLCVLKTLAVGSGLLIPDDLRAWAFADVL